MPQFPVHMVYDGRVLLFLHKTHPAHPCSGSVCFFFFFFLFFFVCLFVFVCFCFSFSFSFFPFAGDLGQLGGENS